LTKKLAIREEVHRAISIIIGKAPYTSARLGATIVPTLASVLQIPIAVAANKTGNRSAWAI